MERLTETTVKGHNDDRAIENISRISDIAVRLDGEFEESISEQLQNFYRVMGKILSEADRQKLFTEKRPAFQINLFAPIVMEIVGQFKGSYPGIDIVGVGQDDQKTAKLLKMVNDNILNTTNDSLYELSKAFLYAIIGRYSWIKQEWSYEDNPQGQVSITHYDRFLKFDTANGRRDLNRTQFLMDEQWLTPEEIIRIYAKGKSDLEELIIETSESILGDGESRRKQLTKWSERLSGMSINYSESKGFDADTSRLMFDRYGDWHKNGRFRVVDFYERRENKVELFTDRNTGQDYDVTKLSRDLKVAFKEKLGNPYIWEDVEKEIYQVSIVPGMNIQAYEGPQELQNRNYKFTRVDCFDWHPDVLETKSVVDFIKDPIASYNLRENTNITYLMRAAHGVTYVEEQYADAKTLKKLKSNEIAGIVIVPNGSIRSGGFREKELPQVNQALVQHQDQKSVEIEKISGSGPNTRGLQESSGESGKLFNARVKQSNVMREWISENAQHALTMISKNNIWYTQNKMDDERVIRILQDDDKPYWLTINQRYLGKVLNDVTVGQYDVTISITPYGKEAKEEELENLYELFEGAMKLQKPLTATEILKAIIKLRKPVNMTEIVKLLEMETGIQAQQIEQMIVQSEMDSQNQMVQNELQNESTILGNQMQDANVQKAFEEIQMQQQQRQAVGM